MKIRPLSAVRDHWTKCRRHHRTIDDRGNDHDGGRPINTPASSWTGEAHKSNGGSGRQLCMARLNTLIGEVPWLSNTFCRRLSR